MCQPTGSLSGAYIYGCCCGPLNRRFISTEEEQERLEEYQNQLQKELEGVEEHIRKLKGN